jgi:hypothetical protein
MKYCRNCKHRVFRASDYYCDRSAIYEIVDDPVIGPFYLTKQPASTCNKERQTGQCGIEAKYYSPDIVARIIRSIFGS